MGAATVTNEKKCTTVPVVSDSESQSRPKKTKGRCSPRFGCAIFTAWCLLGMMAVAISRPLWIPGLFLKDVTCDPPHVDNHGSVRSFRNKSGLFSRFECNPGYYLQGESTLQCVKNGDFGFWNGEEPRCLVISCADPGIPVHGMREGSQLTAGSIMTFSCNGQYYLVGSRSIECTNDGTWLGNTPTCEEVICHTPHVTDNVSVRTHRNASGYFALFSCRAGYELDGPAALQCMEHDGSLYWNGIQPLCSAIRCPDPGTPANGLRRGADVTMGAVLTFSCNSHFYLKGSREIECLASGNWMGQIPTCEEMICDLPPVSDHVAVQTYRNDSGYFALFDCDRGYWLDGPSSLQCVERNGILLWEGLPPQCPKRNCSDPGVPVNGERSGRDVIVGSVLTFTCNEHYYLVGSKSIECLSSGEWMGIFPTCEEVACQLPEVTSPLSVRSYNNEGGQFAVFHCEPGYWLNGDRTLECVAHDGLLYWEGKLPVCSVTTCPDPGVPLNGKREGTTLTVGSVLNFFCDEHYHLAGSELIECTNSGDWMGNIPTCEEMPCQPPQVGNNTSVKTHRIDEDVYALFECDVGFWLDGESSLRCEENVTTPFWDGVIPTCKVISCMDPGVPLNGERKGTSLEVGVVLTFSCNDQHYLVGSETIECTSAGVWMGNVPTCQEIVCDLPEVPEHVSVESYRNESGLYALFACEQGFSLDGSESLRCVENEGVLYWEGRVPTCPVLRCPDPGVPLYGEREGTELTVGSTLNFSCNDQHYLFGSPSILCLSSGEWLGNIPVCEEIACELPNMSEHVSVRTYRNERGLFAQFDCDLGFWLDGPESLQCVENAGLLYWDGTIPTCKVNSCPDPGVPANGDRVGRTITAGAVLTFTCHERYYLVGSSSIECLESGTWMGTIPTCQEIPCQTSPDDAHISVRTHTNSSGVYGMFDCGDGYWLDGETSLRCLEEDGNAFWDGTVPRCRINTCPDPGVPEHGERIGQNLTVGSVMTFTCHGLYTLVGSKTIECMPSGTWLGNIPICEDLWCRIPELPDRMSAQIIRVEGALIATFDCEAGYRVNGQEFLPCVVNGGGIAYLDGPLPTCSAITCPDPGVPRNGRREGVDLYIGAKISFTCDAPYHLNGSSSIECMPSGTWLGNIPTCEEMLCEPPRDDKHISVRTHLNSSGVYGLFQCDIGYWLDGEDSLRCLQEDGVAFWDGIPPTCNAVYCPDPGVPMYGERNGTELIVGTVLTFSCPDHLFLQGSKSIECTPAGTWLGNIPTCEVPNCEIPQSNEHLLVQTYRSDSGLFAEFECGPGYELMGPRLLHCTSYDGAMAWDWPVPICSAVSCPDPGEPLNGVREGSEMTFGSVLTFSCNENYYLFGSATMECSSSGMWLGTRPTCQDVPCDLSEVGEHITVRTHTNSSGGYALFECDTGFRLEGASSLRCIEDSTGAFWDGILPVCKVLSCPDPGVPTNGFREGTEVTVGSFVDFTCGENYRLVGSSRIECSPEGTWLGNIGICEEIICELPELPDYVAVQVYRNVSGHYAAFDCDPGYVLEGDSVLQCVREDNVMLLAGSVPSCTIVSCPEPGIPLHGRRAGTDLTMGSVVTFTCQEDYRLVGSRSITCQTSGEWLGDIPICEELSCEMPDLSEHLSASTFRNRSGIFVQFHCDFGYWVNGAESLKCIERDGDTLWEGPVPTCSENSCPDPGVPLNGEREGTDVSLGSIVTFRCYDNYRLIGSSRIECLPSGLWMGNIPLCEADENLVPMDYASSAMSVFSTWHLAVLGTLLVQFILDGQ